MLYTFLTQTDTPSSKLVYTINLLKTRPEALCSIVNKDKFDKLCASGCLNYRNKWSCPPYAPLYNDFIMGWYYLYIFYVQMDLIQFAYIKNDYLKVKAANSILKARVDKYLRHMATQYGKYISTGSCRLCKPCRCKMGKPCAHPSKMSYSFEAMGIDVSALVEQLFKSTLLWYKPKCLPEYTSVVCGLLTNADIPLDILHDEYIRIVK